MISVEAIRAERCTDERHLGKHNLDEAYRSGSQRHQAAGELAQQTPKRPRMRMPMEVRLQTPKWTGPMWLPARGVIEKRVAGGLRENCPLVEEYVDRQRRPEREHGRETQRGNHHVLVDIESHRYPRFYLQPEAS